MLLGLPGTVGGLSGLVDVTGLGAWTLFPKGNVDKIYLGALCDLMLFSNAISRI